MGRDQDARRRQKIIEIGLGPPHVLAALAVFFQKLGKSNENISGSPRCLRWVIDGSSSA